MTMTTARLASVLVLAGIAPFVPGLRSAPFPSFSADARDAPTVALDIPDRADSTPWIAAAGSMVAVAWGASADGKADVFVAISPDGGQTFGSPVRVNQVSGEGRLGGELPPRVAITGAGGSASSGVVVLWNARGARTEVKIARSRDGGATFGTPVSLQTAEAAGDRGWPALALDRQGRAHAVWLDHRGMAARRAASGASGAAAVSGTARHVHGGGAPADGAVMAQGSALYHAALDESPSASAVTERAVAAGVCYCCKTALATGPDDTLFAAWRHVYAGDLRDMAMAVSRDGGRSFSTPARVSEDGWAINGCPDDGPSVVVDARGVAHIVWPTVIGGNQPQGALFYSTTSDGRHFTPRVRIPTLGGPQPAHPQITIGPSGRLVVAWDEVVAGERRAALREIEPGADGTTRFGEVVSITSGGMANHPVVAATADAIVAAWATGGDESRVETRRIQLP